MKKWTYLLIAVAAMGAVAMAAAVTLQRARRAAEMDEIPQIIEDCFERIRQIEKDLQRLRPAPGPAG